MVDAVEIVVHLGAERAASERVLGVPRQPLRAAVPDLHHPGARVGTIVPARAADDVKRSRRHRMPSIATMRVRLAPVKIQTSSMNGSTPVALLESLILDRTEKCSNAAVR